MKKQKIMGITVGGPASGIQFLVNPYRRYYFFPTPASPFYAGAYYTLTNKVTVLKEIMATFSHCLTREK